MILSRKHLSSFVFLVLVNLSFNCQTNKIKSPIPNTSDQMLLVIAEENTATKGILRLFQRDSQTQEWQPASEKIPVVLGRNGLSWGRGLHTITDSLNLPANKEGDGRSPAGVFTLGTAFGYAPTDSMFHLKILYLHITEAIECVDDLNSAFYNHLVSRSELKACDWQSSEKMSEMGVYYELGVFINQNANPVINGDGSCIFLHNWSTPDETMAGCTAMAPENMEIVVNWLDDSKNPLLVQLTRRAFDALKKSWHLPEF